VEALRKASEEKLRLNGRLVLKAAALGLRPPELPHQVVMVAGAFLKTCSRCELTKPLIEFHAQNASAYGRANCKACVAEYGRRYSARKALSRGRRYTPRVWPSAVAEGQKICSRCGETKPLGEFNKHKHTSQCRGCVAELGRERRARRAAAAGRAYAPRKVSSLGPDGKTCLLCGVRKPLADFGPKKDGVGGHRARCRECERSQHFGRTKEQRQEYRRRAALAAGRVYMPLRKAGRRALSLEVKAQREVAREAKRASEMAARELRRAILVREKPWLDPNLTSAQAFRIRYRLDPDFNLRQRLRAASRRKRQGKKIGDLLRAAVKSGGRAPSVERLVGYTVPDLRRHLERQFGPGMDWRRFCAGEIHIDHILPLASFDLSDPEQLKRAWALPNLRPLPARINLKKAALRLTLL